MALFRGYDQAALDAQYDNRARVPDHPRHLKRYAEESEAARRALTRFMKRQGRVWIRIFPDVPVSKKPAEVRQGKGKGTPEFWICRIKPGRILFEMAGIGHEEAVLSVRLPAQDRAVGIGARRCRAGSGARRIHRRDEQKEKKVFHCVEYVQKSSGTQVKFFSLSVSDNPPHSCKRSIACVRLSAATSTLRISPCLF